MPGPTGALSTLADINFLTKQVTAAVLGRAIHHALAAPAAVADDSLQVAS